MNELHHSPWCHQQTCCQCTQFHCLCHCWRSSSSISASLKDTTHYMFWLWHRVIDCNSLHVAIQPTPYTSNSSSIKQTALQFSGKNVAGAISKALQKSRWLFSLWCSHSTIEDHQISQSPFFLVGPWWLSLTTSLSSICFDISSRRIHSMFFCS